MNRQSIPTQLARNLPGEDATRVSSAVQGSAMLPIEGERDAGGHGEEMAAEEDYEGSPVEHFGYHQDRFAIPRRNSSGGPPGIWESDGDELIRVDRFDPQAEELVACHPHLWRLDGNQLIPVEEYAPQADALMIEFVQQLAEGLAPLEIPDMSYLPTVEDLIEMLVEPDEQMLVEVFFDNMNKIFIERANNLDINQPRITHDELHRHFSDFEATLRAFQLLEATNPHWLEEVLVDLREALLDLNPDSALIARRAHRITHLLDRVKETSTTPSLISEHPAREPAGCSVCLTEYHPYSLIVVLPCHPSHHFHRRCIESWLVNQLNCPICRATLRLSSEETHIV